jgi:hypothetical protein
MENSNYGNPIALPNATLILVFGILSIVACCFYGIAGIVFGIVTLVLAAKATKLYNTEPSSYTESSFKNVNAGKICAIIGLALSALLIIIVVWVVSFIGWEVLNDPDALQQWVQEHANQ